MNEKAIEKKPSHAIYLKLISHPVFKLEPEKMEAVAELIYQSGYRLPEQEELTPLKAREKCLGRIVNSSSIPEQTDLKLREAVIGIIHPEHQVRYSEVEAIKEANNE